MGKPEIETPGHHQGQAKDAFGFGRLRPVSVDLIRQRLGILSATYKGPEGVYNRV